MTKGAFTVQLESIADGIIDDMEAWAVDVLQDVVGAMQTSQVAISAGASSFEVGKIPVDSKDLISSLSVDDGPDSADSYIIALGDYDLGDNMSFKYSEPYAMRIEAGFQGEDELGRKYNQEGRHFMGTAVRRTAEFGEKRAKEYQR